MKTYHSTRNNQNSVSFHEAVLQGIASDGGLYVTDSINDHRINLNSLVNKNYQEIAEKVLSCFIDDFSPEQIKECIEKAYGKQFDDERITPLAAVGKHHILELFHGPTCAFKDIALQILPHFMKTALEIKENAKDIVILTATSGDTGKAALEGFKDVEHINIVVFYPEGLVSEIQERQMITTEGNNTAVIAVKGNFDDAQSAVKQAFGNKELNELMDSMKLQFSSANSINIGRLCPQIVYYFYAYMQLVDQGKIQLEDEVNFVVPTGNFGNILAGYYAKLLGLPVHRLILASNQNHILTDFFTTGVYDRNRPLEKTISPSMDILVSSNLERLLYQMTEDCAQVEEWMKQLSETGRYQIPQALLKKMNETFYCGYSDDEACREMIKHYFTRYGYIMDTHTSCAAKVLRDYLRETEDDHENIILSTASCYKFSSDVYHALTDLYIDNEWDTMAKLKELTHLPLSRQLETLKDLPVLHTAKTAKEKINAVILQTVKEKFI